MGIRLRPTPVQEGRNRREMGHQERFSHPAWAELTLADGCVKGFGDESLDSRSSVRRLGRIWARLRAGGGSRSRLLNAARESPHSPRRLVPRFVAPMGAALAWPKRHSVLPTNWPHMTRNDSRRAPKDAIPARTGRCPANRDGVRARKDHRAAESPPDDRAKSGVTRAEIAGIRPEGALTQTGSPCRKTKAFPLKQRGPRIEQSSDACPQGTRRFPRSSAAVPHKALARKQSQTARQRKVLAFRQSRVARKQPSLTRNQKNRPVTQRLSPPEQRVLAPSPERWSLSFKIL